MLEEVSGSFSALREKIPTVRYAYKYDGADRRSNGGDMLLVLAGSESGRPDVGVNSCVSVTDKLQCELCKAWCEAKDMRLHMEGHLLLEDAREWTIRYGNRIRPPCPCAMCGIRETQGFEAHDLQDLAHCETWLNKNVHSTWKVYHRCKLAGESVYNFKSCAKCTQNNPCTNVPIKCTLCAESGHELFVMKYQLNQHLEDKHADKSWPEDLVAQAEVTESEREWLRDLSLKNLARSTVRASISRQRAAAAQLAADKKRAAAPMEVEDGKGRRKRRKVRWRRENTHWRSGVPS